MVRIVRPLLAAVVAVGLVAAVPGPQALAEPAGPGAAGAGDRLFPGLGNGGYDVVHYDLALDYDAGTDTVAATAGITARTTHPLSRFDLDFDGNTITRVEVDGVVAEYRRDGEELVVTPAHPLRGHFRVDVSYFADPRDTHTCVNFTGVPTGAWLSADDRFALAGQPACMHSVFPSNDIPYDKATYTFTVTTPDRLESAANGRLVSTTRRGDRVTRVFDATDPMSTQVVQIAVGDFVTYRHRADDGTTLRDYVPPQDLDAIEPRLREIPGQIRWLTDRIGVRYPFSVYGILASEVDGGMETQTLSIWPTRHMGPEAAPFLLHELAHQWYGDSVAIKAWSDWWLSEAHALFLEFEYRAEHGGTPFEQQIKAWYAEGDRFRAENGPVARPTALYYGVSMNSIYLGGATALFALREKVGTETFRRIERAWLHRYAGRAADTDDYIALASAVAHRDLRPFLRAWLYGTKTPPMPGHPDWTVNPVE